MCVCGGGGGRGDIDICKNTVPKPVEHSSGTITFLNEKIAGFFFDSDFHVSHIKVLNLQILQLFY